jgi:hypothetical protein
MPKLLCSFLLDTLIVINSKLIEHVMLQPTENNTDQEKEKKKKRQWAGLHAWG